MGGVQAIARSDIPICGLTAILPATAQTSQKSSSTALKLATVTGIPETILLCWQNFTIDHIIAETKGGTNHIEFSLGQLLCGYCNSLKVLITFPGDGSSI